MHGSKLPTPLIVPGAVAEVQERVDARGNVVVELDTDAAVEQITRMIATCELDSIAVALLWSFANPAHEEALAQAIPGVFVSRSSEVSPRLGEYERTVATVLNGYVGPASWRYLTDLESRLATPLLVMQSSGGVLPASTATPLGTINSGPPRPDRRRDPGRRVRPRPCGRHRHGRHVVRSRAGDRRQAGGGRGQRHRPVHLPAAQPGRALGRLRRRLDRLAGRGDRRPSGRPGQRRLRAGTGLLRPRGRQADSDRRRRRARPGPCGHVP